MKLISCTNFVLEQKQKMKEPEDGFNIEKYNFIINVCNYANFLKQPLTLGMFVPCDKKGNVYVDYKNYQPKKGDICIPYEGLFEVSKKGKDIEFLNEPQFWKDDQRYYNKRKYEEALKEYQEVKERVLFEGFESKKMNKIINEIFDCCETIEDMLKNGYNIVLTESAKQKIFNT